MLVTYKQSMNDYFNYLDLKRKKSSCRTIKNRLTNYLLKYVDEEAYVNDLTTFEYLKIQSQINELNLSNSYKRTIHTCIVTYLNFCRKFYGLQENVASWVGNFSRSNEIVLGHIWSLEEFYQFIDVVDEYVYKIFFTFLYFSGVRLGEALGLSFKNVDFEIGTIYVVDNLTRFIENGKKVKSTTKTRTSTREIGLDQFTLDLLKQLQRYYIENYNNYSEEFYVFGGTIPLAPTTIDRKKRQWCELANVQYIKNHEFRHSHACLLFENNIPIKDIAERLGHAKPSMTLDIYLRYRHKDEKRVLHTLNSLQQNYCNRISTSWQCQYTN